MGVGTQATIVHVVDFGLAKRYLIHDTHIPYNDHCELSGTARFSSLNVHFGVENTRRDDMESLVYVLLYFLRGSLPWQHIHDTTKERELALLNIKKKTSTKSLCSGFPSEFGQFLEYTRSLNFSDSPDYAFIRCLFASVRDREGYRLDGVFDWTTDVVDHGRSCLFDYQPGWPGDFSNASSSEQKKFIVGNRGYLPLPSLMTCCN